MTFVPQTALITGASRGLGRALALELARRDVRLALVARDEAALHDTVHGLRAQGAVAYGIAADVGDKLAIHRIAGQAQALLGPLDLLIHNASTLGPTPLRLLLDTECEELSAVLETNLLGPFRLSKVLAGAMALRGAGLVLHVSSDAAVEAYPRWGAYAVSKAALDHLTRVWAEELRDTGVRVLSVDPGEMGTAMHRAAVPEADPATLAHAELVARKIVHALFAQPAVPTGTRLVASQLEDAR
jgi:NAD(P)-dependent dehydrogenase (short-subunit alcohol dehydrogenase family)